MEHAALHPRDMAGGAVDEAKRGGDDGVEHRARIRRRLADHAQDFGRRGLPFQRLLRLLEQAHVLNGDNRLVAERLQEGDFPVRKCPGHSTEYDQNADAFALAHQGQHGGSRPAGTLENHLLVRRQFDLAPVRNVQ